MKKILLAIFSAATISATANAQTEKGTLMLGGGVNFSSIESTSMFSATPNIGFFAIDNLAIGAELSLLTSESYTAWGVGPFARYYFTKNMKGKPFLGASLNIGGADDIDTQVGFGARAGYALFLNKSIALEFGVSYNRTEGIDMIGVGAGFQIHFKR